MGEIWPKKKSAGRRSIIEGTVPRHRELPEAVDGPGKGVRDRSPAGLPGVPADSSMSRTMMQNLAPVDSSHRR
eukprot:COSAG04_NODE_1793_length_5565_cov_52.214782_2_plen_73_part_00